MKKESALTEQLQYALPTPIGPLYLVASNRGLRGVFFGRQPVAMTKTLIPATPAGKTLSKVVRQLKEYFAGKRKQFDITFDLSGTPFQQSVWRALYKIPFGKTVSYSDIAKRIDNPKAVRAVGSANGKNPACVIIPCHRVIAADGSIGGYSGGLGIKRKLLTFEHVDIPA